MDITEGDGGVGVVGGKFARALDAVEEIAPLEEWTSISAPRTSERETEAF
jgi:hypothetical protein